MAVAAGLLLLGVVTLLLALSAGHRRNGVAPPEPRAETGPPPQPASPQTASLIPPPATATTPDKPPADGAHPPAEAVGPGKLGFHEDNAVGPDLDLLAHPPRPHPKEHLPTPALPELKVPTPAPHPARVPQLHPAFGQRARSRDAGRGLE